MTEHRRDKDRDAQDKRLATLYREAGDVEPDGGLDRIIRARADEAAGRQRSTNRLPWLGGLVTASVAIVAIAVVVQQTPPSQPSPEPGAPLERSAPEAYMAPSMGAQLQQESQREVSADVRRARAETLGEQDASVHTHRAEAREALPEPIAEPRPAVPSAPPADADDSVMNRLSDSSLNAADSEALKSRDGLIEKLRALIEAQRIDEARRMLDEAEALEPELELPEDIERALRAPGPDRPDPGPDSEKP